MTNAIAATGATLTWNGQAVAEITKISGPSISVDMLDVTVHGSTDSFREFIAGLRDGGEVTIEGKFHSGDTDGQIAFITDMTAGTSRTAVITGPTAAAFTWTFTGLGSAFSIDEPHDAELTFTATIKVSGKPVLAVTASGNLTGLTGIEENAGAALTFLPAFAAAKKSYNVTVNTASTYIKLTPTLAGATITITTDADDSSQDVASGAQSGTIAITDAAVTTVTLDVKEPGKVANRYTLYIYCP